MAQRLVAVANVTGKAAGYSSIEYPNDTCDIPNNAVTHTGGKDNDFVKIADCSDSSYFPGHHCTIAANDGSWTVTFWNDDDNGHMLYWSPGDFFTTEHPITPSKDWLSVALVIAPGPQVYCNQWS